MIQTISARHDLLLLVGQPVAVRATIQRTGTLPYRPDRFDLSTLLLVDIQLEGVRAPIEHAWITLGPGGSERARRYDLRRVPTSLEATIIAYRAGEDQNEIRLGLGEPRDICVYVGERWRTLARRREVVESERAERLSQHYVDSILEELLLEQQRPVLEELRAYAASYPVDRAVRQMLDTYFVRRTPVSPGQLRHAAGVLQ